MIKVGVKAWFSARGFPQNLPFLFNTFAMAKVAMAVPLRVVKMVLRSLGLPSTSMTRTKSICELLCMIYMDSLYPAIPVSMRTQGPEL